MFAPVFGFADGAGVKDEGKTVEFKIGASDQSGSTVLGVEKTVKTEDGGTVKGSLMVEDLNQARFRLQYEGKKNYFDRVPNAYYIPASADWSAVVGDQKRGQALASIYKVGIQGQSNPDYAFGVKLKIEAAPYVGLGKHGDVSAVGAGIEVNTELGIGLQLDALNRLDANFNRKTYAQIVGANQVISDEQLKELRWTHQNAVSGQKAFMALQSINLQQDSIKDSATTAEMNNFTGLTVGGAF